MVLLRHETPDGGHHFDWLLAPDARPGTALVSFRLQERLDTLVPGAELAATAIPDHRAVYLTYEGTISGDRGSVRRVNDGVVRWLERGEGRMQIIAAWAGGPDQEYRLICTGPATWRVFCWRSATG
jgi:hypothetical protein